MFQYDEQEDEHIILCINCDAEYTITRFDDEEESPPAEFCPFCGYHQEEYDDEDEEDLDEDEDDEKPFMN